MIDHDTIRVAFGIKKYFVDFISKLNYVLRSMDLSRSFTELDIRPDD